MNILWPLLLLLAGRGCVARIFRIVELEVLVCVIGCVLAGFYLLRLFDLPTATSTAAGINVAVALLALALAQVQQSRPMPVEESSGRPRRAPGAILIYIAIALSGLTALGAEVVW